MAKPRIQSADIATLLGQGSLAQKLGPAISTSFGTEGVSGAHPVRDRSDAGIARAENTLILHPSRIVRRGRYVRPFTDDQRFRDLVTAIQEAGNAIHVPILVRTNGPPGAVEYVLVDGTHRLEAARRLDITVPALNLGRITPEDALAIQAMANEVRASMHVVDQSAYIVALAVQGLARETIQRTIGFSAGRVSELLAIGMLLDRLTDAERDRARRSARVTYRALRTLKATTEIPDAFRQGVMSLVAASESDGGGELDDADASVAAVRERRLRDRRTRASNSPRVGLTFVPTKNSRGTSVTYRIAWRARAIRSDPEAFLLHVREILSRDRGRSYESNTNTPLLDFLKAGERPRLERSPAKKPSSPTRGKGRPHIPLARSVRSSPMTRTRMPMPASRRRDLEATAAIDPNLLSGLSLPMLSRRLKESRR